ncbi:MAG TPA: helix-turn-helix domain-containing protein, partial [Puia sp.]|nr:helix-turn-helix domain-containing protein [Puia sp.]
MKRTSARDNIVSTASRLFYKQGYSNTGINQIIEEAGIAKSTLYQWFRSKEELLLVYLEETGKMTMEGLRDAAATASTPKEKLLAIFDHLAGLVVRPEFYGCHFLNIVYEMPDGNQRARAHIKKQKDAVRSLF